MPAVPGCAVCGAAGAAAWIRATFAGEQMDAYMYEYEYEGDLQCPISNPTHCCQIIMEWDERAVHLATAVWHASLCRVAWHPLVQRNSTCCAKSPAAQATWRPGRLSAEQPVLHHYGGWVHPVCSRAHPFAVVHREMAFKWPRCSCRIQAVLQLFQRQLQRAGGYRQKG